MNWDRTLFVIDYRRERSEHVSRECIAQVAQRPRTFGSGCGRPGNRDLLGFPLCWQHYEQLTTHTAPTGRLLPPGTSEVHLRGDAIETLVAWAIAERARRDEEEARE